MVHHLDKRFKYSLKVRHPTWFNDDVDRFLRENDISLVWSVRDKLQSPSVVTSDQLYIRFIGDRSISERDFDKTVKDRRKEMHEYVKKVKEGQHYPKIIQIIESDFLFCSHYHYVQNMNLGQKLEIIC
jgi:uncharacterized protein YecE (DUF72 family)